jgi:hypothetical protein
VCPQQPNWNPVTDYGGWVSLIVMALYHLAATCIAQRIILENSKKVAVFEIYGTMKHFVPLGEVLTNLKRGTLY